MVALLIVLGGVALYLTNQNKGNSADVTPTPVPSYLWQETAAVQGIDVVSGTQKVSLHKDISTTTWLLTEPVQAEADTFQIENVASSLQSLQATKVATSTTDLAQFGLDTPGMTVTATFSSTTPLTHTIMVGKGNFDQSSYYVKEPSSSDVYLVSTSTIGQLQNWLTSPPVLPPTATPFPTLPPTATATTTVQATPQGPVGPPSQSSPSPAVTTSPAPQISPTSVLTGTVTSLGVPTLSASEPGAATSTTPVSVTPSPSGRP